MVSVAVAGVLCTFALDPAEASEGFCADNAAVAVHDCYDWVTSVDEIEGCSANHRDVVGEGGCRWYGVAAGWEVRTEGWVTG